MSIEQEIRDQIENIKKLKMAVGEINNHLSALEQLGKDSKENVYQKGCEEGYANGYKKGIEDGKACYDNGCKGCKWESQKGYDEPCKHCCNAYRNEFTPMPKDDPIKVGDEVGYYGVADEHGNVNYRGVVLEIREDDYLVMEKDGKTYTLKKKLVMSKTGRHFDVQSILEAMQYDPQD